MKTMGRLKEAEEQYHASLKLLPQNRQVEGTHAALDGLLNIDRGNYEEAVRLFQGSLGDRFEQSGCGARHCVLHWAS